MSNFLDQLIYTTVRIEATYPKGHRNGEFGVATGFFFRFVENEVNYHPVVVTNRHVTEGATSLRFTISTQDGDGNPVWGKTFMMVTLSPADHTLNHPDPSIDLAVVNIAELILQAKGKGYNVFFKSFGVSDIATDEFCRDLTAVEDILMCGYPVGLWDSHNNLPITRTGTTATPVFVDRQGKREFVINCPCYPGCSGSPVIHYRGGTYTPKSGGLVIGPRSQGKLLGIQFAVPDLTSNGELHILPTPTATKVENAVTKSPFFVNLGYCIKATELIAFEEILRQARERAA